MTPLFFRQSCASVAHESCRLHDPPSTLLSSPADALQTGFVSSYFVAEQFRRCLDRLFNRPLSANNSPVPPHVHVRVVLCAFVTPIHVLFSPRPCLSLSRSRSIPSYLSLCASCVCKNYISFSRCFKASGARDQIVMERKITVPLVNGIFSRFEWANRPISTRACISVDDNPTKGNK